jgi:hypothetical protein
MKRCCRQVAGPPRCSCAHSARGCIGGRARNRRASAAFSGRGSGQQGAVSHAPPPKREQSRNAPRRLAVYCHFRRHHFHNDDYRWFARPSILLTNHPPMTLRNMRSLGVRSLAVACELRHHEAVLDDAVLVHVFRPCMVCPRCGICPTTLRLGREGQQAQILSTETRGHLGNVSSR